MRRTSNAVLALLIVATAAPLAAQSLADVARQEEERRKAIRTPGKVYTNENLQPEPPPSTPPAAAPAAPAAPAPPASPEGTPPAGAQAPQTPGQPPAAQPPSAGQPAAPVPQTEAEWRKRITSARDALTRSQMFGEALQTRINSLSTDFVNRDDPIQRDQIAAERDKTLAELDRVRREIRDQQKAITAIQEEARKAGVPAGWVR